MKFLVDENLSPQIATAFQGDFPGSIHFHFRIGNASTANIEAALRSHRDAIKQLEADPGLAVLVI